MVGPQWVGATLGVILGCLAGGTIAWARTYREEPPRLTPYVIDRTHRSMDGSHGPKGWTGEEGSRGYTGYTAEARPDGVHHHRS